ncbi:MAG: ABC transporter permease [Anaerolineae bacterium]|nr:ABC transporter permease [Anaerolineae bacterium]
MTFWELVSLALDNLGRRKGRVALTAIGVVIGTSAVVMLVSMAVGLQQTITQQIGGIGDLTQVMVFPAYTESFGLSAVRPADPVLLTDQSLRDFAELPGVVNVIARDNVQASTILNVGRQVNWMGVTGVSVSDLSLIGLSADEGSLELSRGTVILGAYVPTTFSDPTLRPGQEPPPPPDLLNRQITLTVIKYSEDGQEVKRTLQVRVVGILEVMQGEPDYSIYMPLTDVTALNEWVLGRRVNRNRDGYPQVIVKVSDPGEAMDTTAAITEMGYQAFSPQQVLQGVNSIFVVLQVVLGGIGAIALLVAAIGIANTMTMAVLERTREIGLLKAVGATNRDVLSIFLGEAAGIGLVGGVGGIAFGWVVGQVINLFAVSYFASQAAQSGGQAPTAIVITPIWLVAFALIFSALVGLISGLYPALRAATLTPAVALKYE